MEMNNLSYIVLFFQADKRVQSSLFNRFLNEIIHVCRVVLLTEFRNSNETLVNEGSSHIIEKLIALNNKIKEGKEFSFVYSIARQFYLDRFKALKPLYVDQDFWFFNDQEDTKIEDDFEEVKIETIEQLRRIQKSSTHPNSEIVITALINLIENERDYGHQYASLYLYRNTGLRHLVVLKCLRANGIKIPVTTDTWFEKIFEKYNSIKPRPLSFEDSIITIWEREAIEYYQDRHVRQRGEHYEDRYFRPATKIRKKTTKTELDERRDWVASNLKSTTLEKDYYKKYGFGITVLQKDKRLAKREMITLNN